METSLNYLFTSDRLGFRPWKIEDLEGFADMNADPMVMQYFPKPLSREESLTFLNRLIEHYSEHGYCYFAVEILQTGEQIGLIGLANQDYPSGFNPATDLGWRLKRTAWGKGYATEGARRCLEYAFEDQALEEIIGTCPRINLPSEQVMKKIGMRKYGEFDHPYLREYPKLQKCVWYKITKDQWRQSSPP